MATTSRATLKGYFNTGDTPTEGNFQDLINQLIVLNRMIDMFTEWGH